MFQLQVPAVNLYFGRGTLSFLAPEVKKLGRRCLLVTGRRTMKELGILDKALDQLNREGIEVWHFGKAEPNPTVPTVDEGARMALAHKCEVIVGLGGGSAIDTAKGIAVLAAHPTASSIWDFSPTLNEPQAITSALPVVAVTSTSGTGSHLTPYYVLTHTDTNEKPGNGHPAVFPRCSIVDLEIVSTMPPSLTAETGFDVMTHVLEGLVSANSSPVSDTLALEAVELVWKNLPIVYEHGDSAEAREKMALADCLAGWVLSMADTVLPHAMAHAISGFYPKISHGMSLATITSAVMRFTIEHAPDSFIRKYCLIAQRMGAAVSRYDRNEAMQAVFRIEELLAKIGMNKSLKLLEVGKEDLPVMTKSCMGMMAEDIARGPVQPTAEEILALFEESY